MIIVIGPDGSGKSSLMRDLRMPYIHYNQHTTYEEFLEPLVNQNAWDIVFDRNCFCEKIYHELMNRKFKFTPKQWHNLCYLTLAYNPLVVLCTYHQPKELYKDDQYLPYEKLERCLELYREFLTREKIPYIEYDYSEYYSDYLNQKDYEEYEVFINILKHKDWLNMKEADWWSLYRHNGNYAIGNLTSPELLIVAERIGPDNTNMIPFETGPTGAIMSDMVRALNIPFNDLAITNYVKTIRKKDGATHEEYTRNPDTFDEGYFKTELTYIKPKRVLLMGGIAKKGKKIVKEHYGDKHAEHILELPHFGAYRHGGRKDMTKWYASLSRFLGYTERDAYIIVDSADEDDKHV